MATLINSVWAKRLCYVAVVVAVAAASLLSFHPAKPRHIAPVSVTDYSHRPVDRPLVDAAGRGNIAEVRRLLAKGSNPNAVSGETDGPGCEAIEAAAAAGSVEIMKLLVAKGAQINAPDYWGGTAIVSAAFTGQAASVQWLIDNGADLTAADDGASALDYAIGQHHADVERILRKAGAPTYSTSWPF